MKILIRYSVLAIVVLAVYACNNNNKANNNKVITLAPTVAKVDTLDELSKLDEKREEVTEVEDTATIAFKKAYNKTLQLWDVPYREINLTTSLGRAHVIVSGPVNAEPLVLLHGMNASSTMWYPNINALSKDRRVYAIDFILEPGKSKLTGEVDDMEGIINWYGEIFDKLKLKQFSLIGASRGGWMAISIALKQPSRVKDLILLSPCQSFMWIPIAPGIWTDISYTIAPKRKKLQDVLESMSVNVGNLKEEFIDQFFIASQNATHKQFILKMKPYKDKELEGLTMPVLLLIGDVDMVNNEKSIRKAMKLLPMGETGIIKDAGHFLSFDQPDIVNARMIDFLKADHDTPANAEQSNEEKKLKF